jgi:hypothetical protein
MAWRVLEHADRCWNVSIAAERRPNSSSKAALFAQADSVSNDDLVALLTQLLA